MRWRCEGQYPDSKSCLRQGQMVQSKGPHRQAEMRATQEQGSVQNTVGIWKWERNNSFCGGWSRSVFTEEMTFELNFDEFVLVSLKRKKGYPKLLSSAFPAAREMNDHTREWWSSSPIYFLWKCYHCNFVICNLSANYVEIMIKLSRVFL